MSSSQSFFRRIGVQLHWQLRGIAVRDPAYRIVSRLRHPERAVTRKTDIIIDGFPRSGNTFAATAFKYAQPDSVHVSSHIHAPIEIITAVENNIPAIVLVRDPEDAAISFIIMLGENVSARVALEYYIRFYETLLPYQDRFVTCSFETAISDFGVAIDAVNDQYQRSFGTFDHSDESVENCFDIIDKEYKEWRGVIRELNVSRPSDSRKDLKEKLRRTVRDPELKDVYDRAYNVYNRFMEDAVRRESNGTA